MEEGPRTAAIKNPSSFKLAAAAAGIDFSDAEALNTSS
jgi:hypothetical protein